MSAKEYADDATWRAKNHASPSLHKLPETRLVCRHILLTDKALNTPEWLMSALSARATASESYWDPADRWAAHLEIFESIFGWRRHGLKTRDNKGHHYRESAKRRKLGNRRGEPELRDFPNNHNRIQSAWQEHAFADWRRAISTILPDVVSANPTTNRRTNYVSLSISYINIHLIIFIRNHWQWRLGIRIKSPDGRPRDSWNSRPIYCQR